MLILKHLRTTFALCSAVLMGVMATPASAKTFEIKSENFTFVGEVSEKNGRALIQDLEVYRSVLMRLFGVSQDSQEARRVQIYGIKGSRALTKYIDRKGLAGVYTITDAGPVYLMNTSGGMRRDDDARRVALHEYAHHIMARYTRKTYPRWYGEGFAEYFSTYYNDEGVITIGSPKIMNAEILAQGQSFPMDSFLGAVRNYPYKPGSIEGNLFYGQSWLAIHYVMNDAHMRKNLDAYINDITDAKNPLQAFEDAFDMTPDEFGVTLKAYLKANKFSVRQFEHPGATVPVQMHIRELNRDEAKLAMEIGRIGFVRDNDDLRKDVQKNLSAMLDNQALAGGALGGLAKLEMGQKNYDQAASLSKRAIEADPQAAMAHYVYGDSYFHKYGDAKSENPFSAKTDDLRAAFQAFEDHLKLDPTHPTSNQHYIQSLLEEADQRLSPRFDNHDARVAHVQRAAGFLIRYYPDPQKSSIHLQAVQALYLSGASEQACQYHRALRSGYSAGGHNSATLSRWRRTLDEKCAA